MFNSKNNNSEAKGGPMSPRISFSTDFVESKQQQQQQQVGFINRATRQAPISSDFEFSVSSSSLQLSADELFSKGRILPLKDRPVHNLLPSPPPQNYPTTTLRDELLSVAVDRSNGDGPSLKPPLKGRWKGFLGLRKSHTGSTNPDSNAHKQGMMREDAEASAAADMGMKL